MDVVAKVPRRRVPASRQPSRKMEKPDEQKLGRAGISTTRLDYTRSAPGCQFRPASPTRQEMLDVPVDSGAFAMYQSGSIAEKS